VFIPSEDCLCTSKSKKDKEFVTILGYKPTDENDGDAYDKCSGYWILRHSWGDNYGQEGKIRLCIPKESSEENSKKGTCNVQT
jgi:hypothetical protein